MNEPTTHQVIVLNGGYVLEIDEEAQSAYLSLKTDIGQVFTHPHSDIILVDFDFDGSLAGIEVLNFSAIIPAEVFSVNGSDLHNAILETNTILNSK